MTCWPVSRTPTWVLAAIGLFLAGMTLVVLADDAFLFLFGWELMSLSSWALVMAHQDHPGGPAGNHDAEIGAVAGEDHLLGFAAQ